MMILKRLFGAGLPVRLSMLGLLSVLLFQGCFLVHLVKDGETLYIERKYTVAAEKLKEEFSAEETMEGQAKKAFLIGECYRNSNQTVEAQKWYKIAMEHSYDPIAIYNYALMLKANGKYEEAIEQFKSYAEEAPFNEDAKKQLKATQQALDWQQHPAPYVISSLDNINSPAFDYAPALYANDAIVFTSDRTEASGTETFGWTGEKFSDLFMAESDGNGGFKAPALFSSLINSKDNEGAACFNNDFRECYFTRTVSSVSGNPNANDYNKIFYASRITSADWSLPVQLNFFSDTFNVQHPFLSADGKELYLASDAEGGYGGKDLYVCTKTIDGWSEPVNLGPQVNTAGDEVFPYLRDGKLYFSSDGLPGMGSLDLFVATKAGKQWSNPQNLKPPFNSPAADFGILWLKVPPSETTKERERGIFTSTRPGGKGNDDIYQFVLPKIKQYILNGSVVEKVYDNPKDPNSRVTGFAPLAANDVAITVLDSVGAAPRVLKTDGKGNFKLSILPEKRYRITATRKDYFSKSEIFSSIGFATIEQDTVKGTVRLVLDKIFKEVQVNISNIYYDYNKWNIRPDAALVLDTLVILLNENPEVKVEFGSHTDSRGNDKFNMDLSQKRAQSVVDYLVLKGIDKARLSAKGYGESQLTNKCGNGVKCTEEEHQKNRRTTFKVLSDEMNIESKEPEQINLDPERK